jgi:hypothetical protein
MSQGQAVRRRVDGHRPITSGSALSHMSAVKGHDLA